MRELLLHIGYGKTGSSALQSWLAVNQEKLKFQGINYAGENKAAKSYAVNSGNASMFLDFLFQSNVDSTQVADYYFQGCNKAIISGESLQALRAGTEASNKLEEFLKTHNIRICVVAYMRNIYNHFYSNYIQSVKRQGCTSNFGDWIHGRLEYRPIESYQSLSNIFPMILISYELKKNNLAEAFCLETSIDYTKLDPMSQQRVNRTLNQAEASIIKHIVVENSVHGTGEGADVSRAISDSLINLYPNVVSKVVYFPSVHKRMEVKFENLVDSFNSECETKFGFGIRVLNSCGYERKRFLRPLGLMIAYYRVSLIMFNLSSKEGEQVDWNSLISRLIKKKIIFSVFFCYLRAKSNNALLNSTG